MNSKNLFIVRHGQTDYNKKKMVQGSGIDAPLNQEGRAQARCFYQAYRNYPFDKIYVSGLIRTKESVEEFINDGIPYEALEGLNEISWGTQEGLPFNEESHENYLSVTQSWEEGNLDLRVGGGETPTEVMKRQQAAFQQIMSATAEKNVLICMHGRAMRVLLCWLLNYPLSNMDKFPHENLCLYKLHWSGSVFTVDSINDQSHITTL
ncbi:MAG: histidine phosphatase family protein [Bacteroidota bacterium]